MQLIQAAGFDLHVNNVVTYCKLYWKNDKWEALSRHFTFRHTLSKTGAILGQRNYSNCVGTLVVDNYDATYASSRAFIDVVRHSIIIQY